MNRSFLIVAGVLMTIALIDGQVASATPIDYKVNLTIGAGTVTGDIFTDGTIGALTQSDITNWVLTLNDGVDPAFTLRGPLSGPTNSSVGLNLFSDTVDPLNALASGQLTWRFDQTPPPDGAQELTFAGQGFFGGSGPGWGLVFFNSTNCGICGAPNLGIHKGGASNTVDSASFVTGTTEVVGTAATVPEPATLTLTALGLTGVVTRYRRRRSRSAS